jgi:hypothetical protein
LNQKNSAGFNVGVLKGAGTFGPKGGSAGGVGPVGSGGIALSKNGATVKSETGVNKGALEGHA